MQIQQTCTNVFFRDLEAQKAGEKSSGTERVHRPRLNGIKTRRIKSPSSPAECSKFCLPFITLSIHFWIVVIFMTFLHKDTTNINDKYDFYFKLLLFSKFQEIRKVRTKISPQYEKNIKIFQFLIEQKSKN